ncbi:MAG: methylated-DNA--[protein]-cysteine S-methyltransferase [Candidatus Delongbacteria bacterium]|nr:methylated-DNA--[protein]-cysteine S-methyltransferase [Candidatus Delongbacteria bacterium]MBN2833960.1 methylated-DNA--[protein]-cysteine S-methyltransferase [Candidatus Delongbacteria bacterium]
MIYVKEFTTKFGDLILGDFEGKLCLCDWKYRKMRSTIDNRLKKGFGCDYMYQESDLLVEAERQLKEYFVGVRSKFELPLTTVGTDFQKSIWNLLLEIPYGETVSYRELASKLNNPKAVRAVASANGANSISIFIPCHRVIGSDGSLTGYAGGLNSKLMLLKLESSYKGGNLFGR